MPKDSHTPEPRSPTLHSFADTAALGRQLARALGMTLAPVTVHQFPDGETLVRVSPATGTQAFLLRSLANPNLKLIETLLAADALRRAGAQRVILIAPYLPYMRQDTVFTPGEPISQKVISDCLGRSFDLIVTIEPHLHRTRRLSDVFPCRTVALSAAPILARWIQRTGRRSLIVGPDEESEPWIRAIADTARLPWIVGKKERLGDQRVQIQFPALPSCARAVIVDDIASSGSTLAVAARALRRAGVPTVDAVVVHAIFAPGALERIRIAGIRQIVSCDTIPHPTNAIRVLPLLVATMKEMLV
jgi:ribose-phosphate pyrophosphokinase